MALFDARWGQQKNAQLNITPNCRPTNCEQLRHLSGPLSKLGGWLFSKACLRPKVRQPPCPSGMQKSQRPSGPWGACCLSGPTAYAALLSSPRPPGPSAAPRTLAGFAGHESDWVTTLLQPSCGSLVPSHPTTRCCPPLTGPSFGGLLSVP